jgi:hypothetical protein
MPGDTVRLPDDLTSLFGSAPPPLLVQHAREYVAAATWTFASTMADNPHWYVVRQRAWATSRDLGLGHEALFDLIRQHYYPRRWHGRSYRSIDLDGFSYWIIQDGTVVNRKPVEQAGWDEPPLTLF